MSSFGQFLKDGKRNGVDRSEFGDKIGLNVSAISRIENESQRFSKSKLKALSDLFKIDEQVIKDLYFADKFAREAIQYSCSDTYTFRSLNMNVKYIKQQRETRGQIEFK